MRCEPCSSSTSATRPRSRTTIPTRHDGGRPAPSRGDDPGYGTPRCGAGATHQLLPSAEDRLARTGTPAAWAPIMRTVLALVLLSGCLGAGSATGTGATRPGVMPMLSELPSDPARRDAILDSSNAVAGPEQRKGSTVK